jgi:hypothetical protein
MSVLGFLFLFFIFLCFVICCPFLSERRFSRVVRRIREILFFQNLSQKGRTGTVAAGRLNFEKWKENSKRKQINTE